jgi:putative holliday junction resolvase
MDTLETRILAIDHGVARMGLAISDPLGMFATGLTTVEAKHPRQLWALLQATLAPYLPIKTVVIGLPKHMNGQEGEQAAIVRQFTQQWQHRHTRGTVG